MAQAAHGENVHLQQVLLVCPLVGEKRAIGTLAGAVDQQVDAPLALFQLEYETGQAQRLAEVAGA
ncbi:hypothetical protein D3C86_2183200 [compost metagenome]